MDDAASDALDQALVALGTAAHPSARLEVVWQAYEREEGQHLDRPPTREQRAAVHRWAVEGDGPSFRAKWLRLTPMLHLDVHAKANALAQLGCGQCARDQDATPLLVTFTVPVDPWSAQSVPNRVALREAVNLGLAAKSASSQPWGDAPLCLSIAAVVSQSQSRKDIDNLVKGLLDAMQGRLYSNDNLVQCLTIHRLECAGSDGYYVVGARPALPALSDVIHHDAPGPAHLGPWGGGQGPS